MYADLQTNPPGLSWYQALSALEQQLGAHSRDVLARLSPITLGTEPHPEPEQRRPYGRRMLYRDTELEALLVNWRPGMASAPHDHGGGHGVVVVLRGCVVESTWNSAEQLAAGRPADRVQGWQQGSTLPIQSNSIHMMESVGAAGALTLHVYLGSDRPMRIYDRAERVTFLVKEGAGAWLPQHPRDVLEMQPWLAH